MGDELTTAKTHRQISAESMTFMVESSGWKLLNDHFTEQQTLRLKKIMDPDTDEVSLRRYIVEYEATRKILDYPSQTINEKDLNSGG